MRKIALFLILVFLVGCALDQTNELTGNAVLEDKTAVEIKEPAQTATGTCTDSDRGIFPESAGKVYGAKPDGQYTLYDRCIGDTNIIIEYYCDGNTPLNQNIRCTTKKGCLAGACR
jgi:hypothetical protein